jgi:hypothetical protein
MDCAGGATRTVANRHRVERTTEDIAMMGSNLVLKRRMRIRHLPGRLAAGSFILNEGLEKLDADDDTAKRLHRTASETYPFVADMDPPSFVKALGAGELALGTALVFPFVPTWLVGLGLAGFSGALVNLYAHTPGMRREDSVRPTSQGRPMAKDVWLLGIGLMLLLDRESWFRRRRR